MILVCGPESSGTKAVAAALTLAGGKVKHLSFPYGGDRPYSPAWPAWHPDDYDAVVVVIREYYSTTQSQIAANHVERPRQALRNISEALRQIFARDTNTPFYVVTLESLIHQPTINILLQDLGLNDIPDDYFKDSNAKWYGGPVFHDQRTVQERIGG